MNHDTVRLPTLDHGALVTEAVRAYLYRGNPSALLSRVAAGIALHVGERPDHEDATFVRPLASALSRLSRFWRRREEDHYRPLALRRSA